MEKKSIVNVPFIAYEKEMSGKNKIITKTKIYFSLFVLFLNRFYAIIKLTNYILKEE